MSHQAGVEFALDLWKDASRRVDVFEREERDPYYVDWAKQIQQRTREVLRNAVIMAEANGVRCV